MTESYNLGLSELGQRVQALSDPIEEPRLRPYQGGSSPPSSHPPAERAGSSPAWAPGYPAVPFPPEPLPEPGHQATNGYAYSSSSSSFASGNPGFAPASSPQPPPAPKSLPAAEPEDPDAPKSGLQRAINALRSTLPLVQRLLPLLDGNFATAITALVAPHIAPQTSHPPPVKVDLEPVERGLAEVRAGHRELQGQVQEHSSTLKRVEDQLDRVREATDRNTLEQQELVEDLRSVGGRINTFAIIGLVLLVLSLGINAYLLLQLQHILR